MTVPAPFERFGLGWVFRPPQAPVTITFDRLAERRDEVTAELHVTTRDGGHLVRRRLNLLGSRSLSDLARDLEDLDGGGGWPWKRILVEGCESALEAYRQGAPVVDVAGAVQKPSPIRWQCQDLVMANVVNCWVAAAATGKSTFLKAYCLHHALGIPFLGRPMAQGVPLYLDYEDTEDNFRRTLYQVAGGLGEAKIPRMLWKRGGGPLKAQVHQLAELITARGVSCIAVDAVAAAGGEMGDRGYEAVALDIEQALLALPPVTIILLDHITGDELKAGGVPIKARGATRKYEFVRYQWTLSADREEAARGNHLVGWTHTKTNLTRVQPPFAVRINHDQDQIVFCQADAVSVKPVAERMTMVDRCAAEIRRAGHGLSLSDLCEIIHGEVNRSKLNSLRILIQRDNGRQIHLAETGRDAGLVVLRGANNVVPITQFLDEPELPF